MGVILSNGSKVCRCDRCGEKESVPLADDYSTPTLDSLKCHIPEDWDLISDYQKGEDRLLCLKCYVIETL